MDIILRIKYLPYMYIPVTFSFARTKNILHSNEIVEMYFSEQSKFFFTGHVSKRRMRKIN